MSRSQAFNPDAFVARRAPGPKLAADTTIPIASDGDYDDLPREWAQGLRLLNSIDAPRGASPARWRQLVEDAHRFAFGWHAEAAAAGWTVGAVFGFDPGQPQDNDPGGLVLANRGGRVVRLRKDHRGRDVATIFFSASDRTTSSPEMPSCVASRISE